MSAKKVKCKATWHWPLVCCSALGLMLAACSSGPPAQSSHTASIPSIPSTTTYTPQTFVVHFDSGQAELTPDDRQTMASVADTAKSGARVTIVGKTDTMGGTANNLSLSERRAQKVRNDLVAAGVPENQIQLAWTGESNPNVPTRNHVPNQQNRAVNIQVE